VTRFITQVALPGKGQYDDYSVHSNLHVLKGCANMGGLIVLCLFSMQVSADTPTARTFAWQMLSYRVPCSLCSAKPFSWLSLVRGRNRHHSLSAYLANPAEGRAQYDSDQDTGLTLFKGANGTARGLLSFFAVGGASLY